MFSKAYQISSNYTFPVLVSVRRFDKTVECGLGTFIIINEDGWFVTAAHIFDVEFTHQEHAREIQHYHSEIAKIDTDNSLSVQLKNKHKGKVGFNNKWITNHSFWWGFDGLFCEKLHILKENDLAVGKLQGFNKDIIKQYPVFKNATNLLHGTSLCKLGFPFYEVKASFDESLGNFKIGEGVMPIPRFPIDGIFTRNINNGKSADGQFDIKFIETSSPGLRGQSGGPIFDVNGNIWAIQSKTVHYPLGFSPQITVNGKEIIENQFLNVGIGVHTETICKFLDRFGIRYAISDE